MRIRLRYLRAAGVVAALIIAPIAAAHTGQAPTAAAQPSPSSTSDDDSTQGMTISQRDHSHFKLIWPGQSCQSEGAWGTDVLCESPGNVQINDSLPMFGGGYGGGFMGGFYY